MGSRSRVKQETDAAQQATDVKAKIDHVARAIAELADFVDDLENQLQRIDRIIR